MKRLTLPILIFALLTACTSGDSGVSNITVPSSTSTSLLELSEETSSTSTSKASAEEKIELNAEMLKDHPFSLSLIASFEQPIELVAIPGTEILLVAERGGKIFPLSFSDDGTAIVGETVLDIREEISTLGEGGLLGMAVTTSGSELYLSYTDTDMTSRVVGIPLEGHSPIFEERWEILSLQQPFANHNGGHLVVDQDGMLLIGFGDGGGADDPLENGQDTTNWFGSILRISPVENSTYGIPETNPFFGDEENEPEILIWGLRNPWRFSLDRATGDLWIGDVGQDQLEEVTRLPIGEWTAGSNLGWPVFEADRKNRQIELPGHRLPDIIYGHEDGRCSVTGGTVYRGTKAPEFSGVYIFSDWCDGLIRLAVIEDTGNAATYATELFVENATGFSTGHYQDIYVFSWTGDLFRLEVNE